MVYFYPILPENIAVHFNFSGEPDGWQHKGTFFLLFSMLIIGMNGLFFGIPIIIRKLPISMINLPNKEYWLSPHRAEHTYQWFDNAFKHWGLMINFLLIMTFIVTCYSNSIFPVQLSSSFLMPSLSMFVMLTGIIIYSLVSKFRKLPEINGDSTKV
ncbi:MAG: DUF1648 domain-containing protein [Ignavibacteria bacterium]|nr:DUF1648 domain-containing protein [Ignavibacteria bacterium]